MYSYLGFNIPIVRRSLLLPSPLDLNMLRRSVCNVSAQP